MSNKIQLQTNNINLQSLITRVNAAKDIAASLPEAGGGGGAFSVLSGTTEPTSDIGEDGDVYFVLEE